MKNRKEKQYTINVYYQPIREYYNSLERIANESKLPHFSWGGLYFPSGDIENDLAVCCRKRYVPGLNKDENPETVYTQFIIPDKQKFSVFIKKLSDHDFIKVVSFKADYKQRG